MGIDTYLNSKTLSSRFSDVLKKYDKDSNGFTPDEFSSTLKGMTTIFAKSLIKLTKYDNKFFKELDTDKDKIVTYKELADYVDKEYKLDFYSWMDMQVSDICKEIDESKEKEE